MHFLENRWCIFQLAVQSPSQFDQLVLSHHDFPDQNTSFSIEKINSLTIIFTKWEIALLMLPDVVNILLMTPYELGALPLLMLLNQATFYTFVVNEGGQRPAPADWRLSSGQKNSTFRRFS